MTSFALVAEGITDQITLETILYEHYDSDDADLDITSVQPLRDATDESRQADFGGWEKVFECCSLEIFKNALQFNDYVIVHIDTDCSEHTNYGVSLTEGGLDRDAVDVVRDVIEVLISRIGVDVYGEHKDKIIFAVAVHSIECWLLPLYTKTKIGASRTKNCGVHLARAAEKKDLKYIKEYESIKLLLREFKGRRSITNCQTHSSSFNYFINQLPALL